MSTFSAEEADLIEQVLLEAPGASHNQAPMYPRPTPIRTELDTRLRIADRQVTRCRWCGHHAMHNRKLCDHCRTHGYPTI